MIDNKSMNPIEIAVYSVLLDGCIHTKDDLFELCKSKAVRDVIKDLKRKYGLLIHGRGKWYLDVRHISGDSKAVMLATAEAKANHSNNSFKLAKRESERLPRAIKKRELRLAELAELSSSPDIKNK